VSNPFCGPCSETHHFFDQWLRERDDLQLRIVLLASGDASQIRTAEHMIALGLLKDKKLIAQALNDWYGQSPKVYEKWQKKYPVLITERIKKAFQKQQQWCETAGISFTPAILVNGHILPEPYEVEDLKYLIS
jgi:thioredoxin family protein